MEESIGLTGNEILALVVAKAEDEGISSGIYGHPIGDQMHGAGPAIGLFDLDNAMVPTEKGFLPLLANTYHSVELRAFVAVPEWDMQLVQFRQEEGRTGPMDGRSDPPLTPFADFF
jgi:hypothetical protein